jgi:nitroreductase
MDLTTIDHLLTTTRSVRRRLDLRRPVEPDVLQRCLEIAIQAPNGANLGRYHFVVVTNAATRAGIADYYRKAAAEALVPQRDAYGPRLFASAAYLAEHLHEVPVHLIPCIEGRVERASPSAQASRYGSILPATWSLMLALRARGLGTAWTTLHLRYEREVAQLLGIPEQITQAALLPVAYFTGTEFKPGKRIPARERTYWNAWGQTR